MSARSIPAATQASLEGQASADALLGFLTITHPNLAEPIRVVSDVLDYEFGGVTFIGMPFEFKILTDEDTAPVTELRVQNVDRRIGEALRGCSTRAELRLDILSSADFDLSVVPRTEIGTAATVYAFSRFELVDVTVTPIEITGRVMLRDYSQESWPATQATQSRCPGLFR